MQNRLRGDGSEGKAIKYNDLYTWFYFSPSFFSFNKIVYLCYNKKKFICSL